MESIYSLSGMFNINPIWIALIITWSLVWKGLGLWKSAQLGQKYWFIGILVLNTLGILEIIYLFIVAKKYEVEIIKETE